jgi:hypothetical protein
MTMRRTLLAAALLAAAAFPAAADTRFEATLAGHALLPAATFMQPPQGAPPGFALSGRFTGPENRRAEEPGSVPADTGAPTAGARPAFRSPSAASRCRASPASSPWATGAIGC